MEKTVRLYKPEDCKVIVKLFYLIRREAPFLSTSGFCPNGTGRG
ncbi:hypothetical protein [Methanosarcina sp.]|nr:hypothetical protein [Methanosarcina sp.]MDY9924869.1 hypothetical protein [Methanosarcina sp.]